MKFAACFLVASTILLADVWACQPEQPAATTKAAPAGRKRRSAGAVTVTLVTNAPFDEETNTLAYQKVRQTLAAAAKQQKVRVDRSQFTETIKNEVGKFAIEYSGNLDCDLVSNFIKGIKASTQELAYVLLNCPGRNLQIL